MCDFCRNDFDAGKEPQKIELPTSENEQPAKLWHLSDTLFFIDAQYGEVIKNSIVSFNYCPYCGKKLLLK